jgi:linoleoyl-CoA desaturase
MKQAVVTFAKSVGFKKELNRRVHDYFKSNQIKPRDNPAMYLKSLIIMVWLVSAWTFTVFAPVPGAVRAIGCILVGLAIGAVGMSVGHDANHGGYSKNRSLNRLIGLSYDVIGLSSYLWRFRHNFLHHTYTNVLDHDVEIHGDGLVRMTPDMKHLWYHRYQHIFIWFVYPFIPFYWSLSDLKIALFERQYHDHQVPKLAPLEVITLVGLKLLGVVWLLGIPIFYAGYSPLVALAGYTIAYMTYGLVICVVFMLAHVLEPAEFIVPQPDSHNIDDEWAIFQVRTTVDFAPRNPILNWYVGGLNYQVVHHLFPHVCHIHYPQLAPIVADVCAEFGIRYSVYDTFGGAIQANYQWLKLMGKKLDHQRYGSPVRGQ